MEKWEGGSICLKRAFRTIYHLISTKRCGVLSSQPLQSREGSGKENRVSRPLRAGAHHGPCLVHTWGQESVLGKQGSSRACRCPLFTSHSIVLGNAAFWRGLAAQVCLGEPEEKVLTTFGLSGKTPTGETVNMEVTKKRVFAQLLLLFFKSERFVKRKFVPLGVFIKYYG